MLGPDPRRMTVHVTGERLLTVVDDLHGAARVQREHCAVNLHRQVLTTAERTPDAAEVDADLLERQAEAGCDLGTVDVQPLGGDVDVDPALAVGHGEPRLRPEKCLVLAAELVDAADRDVAGGIGVSVADHEVAHDVRPVVLPVAVTARRPVRMKVGLGSGALHVGDRLERLVDDVDALGCTAGLLRMLCRNDRHRLAVVEDAVDREHRLVGELEPVGLLARDVLVREHRVDARHHQRLARVELGDSRVRVRTAQRVPEEHPGSGQVARVRELACHLGRCVDPRDELAHPADPDPTRRGLRHPRSDAMRTASKIFA